jgi:hypothetical protein
VSVPIGLNFQEMVGLNAAQACGQKVRFKLGQRRVADERVYVFLVKLQGKFENLCGHCNCGFLS